MNFRVGDRVVYRGFAAHHCGRVGTITALNVEHGNCSVRWDDGGVYAPYFNNLSHITAGVKPVISSRARKKNSDTMNEFQEKVLDYLFDRGGNERQMAMKDLIRCGFFGFHHADESRQIAEKYIEDNARRFCDDGIRRFRESVGLKVPKRTIHLMDFAVKGDMDGVVSTYRTVCGKAQDHAGNILHSGNRGRVVNGEKGELCGECRGKLDKLVDL